MIFPFLTICSLVKLQEIINKEFKIEKSRWTKFWDLYSNVSSKTIDKYPIQPFTSIISMYKTIKIIAISEMESYINSHLLKILKPIHLRDNRILVPLFIHDNQYYVCIENSSKVREYDVIHSNGDSAHIVKILNRYVSEGTSPYKISTLTPADFGMENLTLMKLKNNNVERDIIETNQSIIL